MNGFVSMPLTAPKKPGLAARCKQLSHRLRHDRSGLALIEFAFSLPIFMGLGFFGTEVAHLSITQMKMSQIALNMADNASRIGTLNSTLGAKVITEEQINDVFQAASLQAGTVDLYQDGRVILSSLEVNAQGGQRIMWQRCKGLRVDSSDYGAQGAGASGTSFAGMGPAGDTIQASNGTAVMFVELTYTYHPLFGAMFMADRELRQEAAYTVRDKREIGKEPNNNVTAARRSTCDKFDTLLPQTQNANSSAAQAPAAGDGNNGHGNSAGLDPSNPSNNRGLCLLGIICI